MRRIIIIFLLIISVVIASCSQDSVGEQDASIYLGPEPGVKLLFDNELGIRAERTCLARENGCVHIKYSDTIPAFRSLDNKPHTSVDEFQYCAEGPRLIQRSEDGDVVTIHLAKDSWTVSSGLFDNIFNRKVCRVDSFEDQEILGQVRHTVKVLCECRGEPYLIITFAQGLGLVRVTNMAEGKITVDTRLVGMGRVDGE